jgi:O-antigen/teichoic acid export membrane protein
LVFNILLNFILIPTYGVLGASFATFIGFYLNFIFICLFSFKKKLIVISKQLILNTISILVISLVLFFINDFIIKIILVTINLYILTIKNHNLLIIILNFIKSKLFGKIELN